MQFGGNGCTIAMNGDAATDTYFGGMDCPLHNNGRRLRANRFLQNEDAAMAEFSVSLTLNGNQPFVTEPPMPMLPPIPPTVRVFPCDPLRLYTAPRLNGTNDDSLVIVYQEFEKDRIQSGTMLTVCVVVVETQPENYRISKRSIDSFTWYQDGGIEQVSIPANVSEEGDETRRLLLSTLYDDWACNATANDASRNYCWFSTILSDDFFSTNDVVCGVGTMTFQYESFVDGVRQTVDFQVDITLPVHVKGEDG